MTEEMKYSEAKAKLIDINQSLKNNNNNINLDNIETTMEEFLKAHTVAKSRLEKFIRTKDEIMGKINE